MLRVFLLGVLFAGIFARIDNNPDDYEASLLNNKVPDPSGHGSLHNAVCDGCQQLVTEVKEYLKNPESVKQIQDALIKICPMFGGAEQDCENLIRDDFVSLVHQLQALVDDPKKVCDEMKMCSDSPNPSLHVHKYILQYGKRFMTRLRTKQSNAILCDECVFLIKEAKRVVDDNSTQVKLKQYLISSCDELGSFQDQCKQIINENFDDIMTMIDNVLSQPKSLCAEVNLCTESAEAYSSRYHRKFVESTARVANAFHPSKMPETTKMINQLKSAPVGRAAGGCIACKFAFQVVETFLTSSEATLEAIVQQSQKVCTKMPNDVNLQCKDFLGIYGKPVMQMTISNFLKPDEVCKVLTACASSDLQFLNRVLAQSSGLNSVEGRIVCDSCEAAMETVKYSLAKQAVQEELNKAVTEAICPHINPEYEAKCGEVIDAYFPQIWLVIDDAINVQVACKDIKACA